MDGRTEWHSSGVGMRWLEQMIMAGGGRRPKRFGCPFRKKRNGPPDEYVENVAELLFCILEGTYKNHICFAGFHNLWLLAPAPAHRNSCMWVSSHLPADDPFLPPLPSFLCPLELVPGSFSLIFFFVVFIPFLLVPLPLVGLLCLRSLCVIRLVPPPQHNFWIVLIYAPLFNINET